MIPPAYLLGTGGAVGAACRYAVGQWLADDRFPFATLAVNVLGSFFLGVVTFVGLRGDAALFVGVGACGSFTTYSSFSFQTVRLWETGDRLRASAYALGTLCLCLAAASLGGAIATVLDG